VVARWRRPPKPRRVDAVSESEIPVARRDLGSQQAWRSAPPLRRALLAGQPRALSEPAPLVIAQGFTDRLATWRLATMAVATRPVSTWTSLTPLTPPAWTRRRTSPHKEAAGFAPDGGSFRRSATGPGADQVTAARLPARSRRPVASHGDVGPDFLAALTRPTAVGVRGQAALAPAVAVGSVAVGSVARTLRRASAAAAPDAGRPEGPALPGLPRSARPLSPDPGAPPAPTASGTPGSPTATAPASADASAYPRAGIGPVLASLPPTARPLSPVVDGRPLPAGPPSAGAAHPTAPGTQPPGHGLPVVHRSGQAGHAGRAGAAASPTAGFAPPSARSRPVPSPVPASPVPPGYVTIGSSGQRFASAEPARPADAAVLAREIARDHGDELAQAVAPALARLLRPPRDRGRERDEPSAELPR
jgi:hypothetical protein